MASFDFICCFPISKQVVASRGRHDAAKISSGLLLQWRRADEQTGGMLEMSGARLYLVLGTWKKETENKELLIYYHRTLSSLQPMVPSPRVSSELLLGSHYTLEHYRALRIRDLVSQQGLAL